MVSVAHQRIDRPARAVARLVGARHLLQAVLTARHRYSAWIWAGAAIDAAHATSMIALAAARPDRRKLALANALTATAFAASGIAAGRRNEPE